MYLFKYYCFCFCFRTSNIVSIKLPFNSGASSEGIDIECMLLRQSDLEFDHSPLRKSKLHIKQYRHEILRMVKQQQYWQNRSLAKEVREQWWKNTQNDQTKKK